jgi:hypothetical protein
MFTSLLMPALAAGEAQMAKTDALIRGTDVVIGAEIYRRRHHALPRGIQDLVPDLVPSIPSDPFDGKPLRFKVDHGDIVVYSIGSNFTDDGGEVGEPANQGGTPRDLVVRLQAASDTPSP